MRTRRSLRRIAASALLVAAGSTHAADFLPDTVFVHAGAGPKRVNAIGAGLVWTGDWERPLYGGLLRGQFEVAMSQWRARDFGGGQQVFQQFVLLPLLRLQADQGRSPWFGEFGIGFSWLDRRYVTPTQDMSKQFNFYDVLGVGYQLGEERRHELALRYTHVSNGGLKKPNPGEDFLMLRYAVKF